MDSVLRENCLADIVRLCGVANASLAAGPEFLGDPSSGVEERAVSICLQDRRWVLGGGACRAGLGCRWLRGGGCWRVVAGQAYQQPAATLPRP